MCVWREEAYFFGRLSLSCQQDPEEPLWSPLTLCSGLVPCGDKATDWKYSSSPHSSPLEGGRRASHWPTSPYPSSGELTLTPDPVLGHFSGLFSGLLCCIVSLLCGLTGLDSREATCGFLFLFAGVPLGLAAPTHATSEVQASWVVWLSEQPDLGPTPWWGPRWTQTAHSAALLARRRDSGQHRLISLLDRKIVRNQQKIRRKHAKTHFLGPLRGLERGELQGNLRIILMELTNS